jgi:hypothetical protein
MKLNPGLPTQKQHSTGRRLFSLANWDLNLRKKLMKCYMCSTTLNGAET